MEAIQIILNEAESSALGDNNKEVLEAIKTFRAGMKDPDVLDVIWTTQDVLDHVNWAYDYKITVDQAREILRLIERKHDAEIGVTWETISYAFEETTGVQWNPETKTYEQK